MALVAPTTPIVLSWPLQSILEAAARALLEPGDRSRIDFSRPFLDRFEDLDVLVATWLHRQRGGAGLHVPDPIMTVVTPSFVVELA
jgi:hypothetical protein